MFPVISQAESSSTNFKLWGHSFTSGGASMSSSNYITKGSAADNSTDKMTSTNYLSEAGFESLYEEPKLTMSLSETTVVLGTLVTGTFATGSITVSVSTNADFGYSLSLTETRAIQNTQGNIIDDVSDGDVTAGSEEFGVAVSGTDASFANDRAVTGSALTLASRSTWSAGVDSVISFKAAISETTQYGDYSGSYTFIVTSNY
ncbi:MAG: hypothetical protein ABIH21_01820 [Patescibacteria group bacterium]